MDMKRNICMACYWKVAKAWWAKLPKQKWLALGFMVIMLMAAAGHVFGGELTDRPSPLWIKGDNGIIIVCNPRVNKDGIHVCASANTGQRGYCIEVPAEVYYCTGNQPGNKTYDKALLIKEMVNDPSNSIADIDAAVEAWDVDHPVEVSGS